MKPLLFLLPAVMSCMLLQAQSMGIGTTTPNTSAMLEINSSNKGILFPSVADTAAIASPVKGLVIYNNANNKLWYYNGPIGSQPPLQTVYGILKLLKNRSNRLQNCFKGFNN